MLIALALLLSRVNIRHCISGSGHLGLRVNSRSPEILPLALLQPGLVGGGVLKRGCSSPSPLPLQGKGASVLPGKQPPALPPAAGSPPLPPFCWGKDQLSLPWGGLSLPRGWAAGGPLGRLQIWEEGNEERGAWEWGGCRQENLFYFQDDRALGDGETAL